MRTIVLKLNSWSHRFHEKVRCCHLGCRHCAQTPTSKYLSITQKLNHTAPVVTAATVHCKDALKEIMIYNMYKCFNAGNHGSRKRRQLPVVHFLAHSADHYFCSRGWILCLLLHHRVHLHTLHRTTQGPGGLPSQGCEFATHMLPKYGTWKFTVILPQMPIWPVL